MICRRALFGGLWLIGISHLGCGGEDGDCPTARYVQWDGEKWTGSRVDMDELCGAIDCPATLTEAMEEAAELEDYAFEGEARCGFQVAQKYGRMIFVYEGEALVGAVEFFDAGEAHYGCNDSIYIAGRVPTC